MGVVGEYACLPTYYWLANLRRNLIYGCFYLRTCFLIVKLMNHNAVPAQGRVGDAAFGPRPGGSHGVGWMVTNDSLHIDWAWRGG